jgi:hypothetical protein
VTWYIEILLPIIAGIGFIYALVTYIKNRKKFFFIITFFSMLFAQYLFFLSVRSLFIQYHLFLNWNLSLFAAVAITALIDAIKRPVVVRILFYSLACIIFGYISYHSYLANMNRAIVSSMTEANALMEERWNIIPENETVFPALLFRPLSHPIPYGYFFPEVPPEIRGRYLPVIESLQEITRNIFSWMIIFSSFLIQIPYNI